MTEQVDHYENLGVTGENEPDDSRAIEDFEDYKCNGGELEYADWYSEQVERAEMQEEMRREEPSEI